MRVLSCIFMFVIMGMGEVVAQHDMVTRPLVVSFFDNATLLPGAAKLGVVGIPVHPGISIGTEFRYNDNPQNEWFQSARLAYHYHRYVHHPYTCIPNWATGDIS